MKIGSLFSGIGGLEKGLEDAGVGHVVWQCEQDEWCRKVLAKHWPEAIQYDDVTTLKDPPEVDCIIGGFPCTDISIAGRGEGLDGAASGLWWEMYRIIREVQPRWVVIENVSALLNRGLDAVLGSLAEVGYDALWDCVPAQAVGAPHRRDRLFVVAWRVSDTVGDSVRFIAERGRDPASAPEHGGPFARHLGQATAQRGGEELADAAGPGPQGAERQTHQRGEGPVAGRSWPPAPNDLHAWGRVPALSQPSICRLADGLPEGLVRDRRRQLKAYGNAVVPQVAEVIGRLVAELARASDG